MYVQHLLTFIQSFWRLKHPLLKNTCFRSLEGFNFILALSSRTNAMLPRAYPYSDSPVFRPCNPLLLDVWPLDAGDVRLMTLKRVKKHHSHTFRRKLADVNHLVAWRICKFISETRNLVNGTAQDRNFINRLLDNLGVYTSLDNTTDPLWPRHKPVLRVHTAPSSENSWTRHAIYNM